MFELMDKLRKSKDFSTFMHYINFQNQNSVYKILKESLSLIDIDDENNLPKMIKIVNEAINETSKTSKTSSIIGVPIKVIKKIACQNV